MPITEVERYIITKKIVSIPEVQKSLNLGYREVRAIFSKLVEQNKLTLVDDLYYTYEEKTEEIPQIYKEVLWDCIKRGDVSTVYLQSRFALSMATVRKIVDWMTEEEFIGEPPFQEIYLTKNDFIERFGAMEDDSLDTKEMDAFPFWPSQRADFKKKLEEQKKSIRQRILDLETKKEEEEFKEDELIIEEYDEAKDSFDKAYYEALEKIIKANPEASKQEFIRLVNRILQRLEDLKSSLVAIYLKMLDSISDLSEDEFQNIKDIILE